MKRLFTLLLLFFLCSCSAEVAQPLEYQRLPMTVEADISCEAGDGHVKMVYKSSTEYTVSYTSPEVRSGITYELANKRQYICFGQSRIEISEGDVIRGSLAAARMFLLDPTKCTDGAAGEDGTVTVNINTDGINAAVTTCDGQPVRIEGTADGFKCLFTNITITYG